MVFEIGHHMGALTSLVIPIDVLIDLQMVIPEGDRLGRHAIEPTLYRIYSEESN